MKNTLFLLLALFAFHTNIYAKAFDLIVTPSREEEPVKIEKKKPQHNGKKLLVMISSGELEKAGMGMALGLSAAQKGIKTTIVLGAKALSSAKIAGKQNLFLAKQMTHRDILTKAIENGASVQLCYMCVEALGLTKEDFIEGAEIVKSQAIFDTMYEDGTKVLSF